MFVALLIGPGYKGVAARNAGGWGTAGVGEREEGLFSQSDLSLAYEFLRISVFRRRGGTKEATEGSSAGVGTVGGLRVLGVETGNDRSSVALGADGDLGREDGWGSVLVGIEAERTCSRDETRDGPRL